MRCKQPWNMNEYIRYYETTKKQERDSFGCLNKKIWKGLGENWKVSFKKKTTTVHIAQFARYEAACLYQQKFPLFFFLVPLVPDSWMSSWESAKKVKEMLQKQRWIKLLVGGWTNPSEKYANVKLGENLAKVSGWKFKILQGTNKSGKKENHLRKCLQKGIC